MAVAADGSNLWGNLGFTPKKDHVHKSQVIKVFVKPQPNKSLQTTVLQHWQTAVSTDFLTDTVIMTSTCKYEAVAGSDQVFESQTEGIASRANTVHEQLEETVQKEELACEAEPVCEKEPACKEEPVCEEADQTIQLLDFQDYNVITRFDPAGGRENMNVPWKAELRAKANDVAYLMREGFHWTEDNILPKESSLKINDINRVLILEKNPSEQPGWLFMPKMPIACGFRGELCPSVQR
ncbi:hypothetical protein B0T21DRAFT_411595 [Apiosordaria backusii]|uniref:Uncharacterized protein n=1 Tax=Apiosordaria backusii TaxID=314023 RepID=A0AA40EHQ6_9PEZI|nr:hypothetical protein B0T21DRAFT_411595 [Apiosordaria backusii]